MVVVFLEVMIAEYEEQGFIEAGYDKIKVVHGQIPRAQDDVYIRKPFSDGGRVNQRIDLIGNAEDLHGRLAAVPDLIFPSSS
jgi:hypothetical protein